MTNKTAVQQLIELIPSGAEIKTAIFENEMDEKMLDEWLWERIFKGKDWSGIEKQQIINAFKDGFSTDLFDIEKTPEQYYADTFK